MKIANFNLINRQKRCDYLSKFYNKLHESGIRELCVFQSITCKHRHALKLQLERAPPKQNLLHTRYENEQLPNKIPMILFVPKLIDK